jgi:hypothetical protein
MIYTIGRQLISWSRTGMVYIRLCTQPELLVFSTSSCRHIFPLHNHKVRVRCTLYVQNHIVLFEETMKSYQYILLILTSFLRQLWLPRSPYFNVRFFFVGDTERQDFIWKIHVLCKNWNTTFEDKMPVLKSNALHHELRNILSRCEVSLKAEIQHFCNSSMKSAKLNLCEGRLHVQQSPHVCCHTNIAD